MTREFWRYTCTVIGVSVLYGIVEFYLDEKVEAYQPIIAPALILGFLFPPRFLLSCLVLLTAQLWVNIGLHYWYEPHSGHFIRALENNLLYGVFTILPCLLAGVAGICLKSVLPFVKGKWCVR